MKWERIDGGHRSGDAVIYDNGGGFGPAAGGGRWALVIAGKWIANLDTLAAAKAAAFEDTTSERI